MTAPARVPVPTRSSAELIRADVATALSRR